MKKQRISSLTGLKVVSLLCVFWGHCHSVYKPFDLGARSCELLLLLSGFLMLHNYEKNDGNSVVEQQLTNVKKKIIQFYPLHILTFLFRILFMYNNEGKKGILLNLLLLHAWSNELRVYFSLNGLTWYLSVLLFCYFLAPVFINVHDKINKRHCIYFESVCLFLVFVCRTLFEVLNTNMNLGFVVHTFPPIRALDFFMGVEIGYMYEILKDRIKAGTLFFSIIEICISILIVFLCVVYDEIWPRWLFTLLMCPILFVYAINKGIVSRIISTQPFILFSRIQFEFYMIHQIIIVFIGKRYLEGNMDFYLIMLIVFVISIIISIVLKRVNKALSPKFALLMNKTFDFIFE